MRTCARMRTCECASADANVHACKVEGCFLFAASALPFHFVFGREHVEFTRVKVLHFENGNNSRKIFKKIDFAFAIMIITAILSERKFVFLEFY